MPFPRGVLTSGRYSNPGSHNPITSFDTNFSAMKPSTSLVDVSLSTTPPAITMPVLPVISTLFRSASLSVQQSVLLFNKIRTCQSALPSAQLGSCRHWHSPSQLRLTVSIPFTPRCVPINNRASAKYPLLLQRVLKFPALYPSTWGLFSMSTGNRQIASPDDLRTHLPT